MTTEIKPASEWTTPRYPQGTRYTAWSVVVINDEEHVVYTSPTGGPWVARVYAFLQAYEPAKPKVARWQTIDPWPFEASFVNTNLGYLGHDDLLYPPHQYCGSEPWSLGPCDNTIVTFDDGTQAITNPEYLNRYMENQS